MADDAAGRVLIFSVDGDPGRGPGRSSDAGRLSTPETGLVVDDSRPDRSRGLQRLLDVFDDPGGAVIVGAVLVVILVLGLASTR